MRDLTPLRAAILRFFLEDGAKQTYEFIAMFDTQTYGEKQVRRMIYAMHLAGLLEKLGNKRNTLYITTRIGFIVLASLQDEGLSDKAP